MSASIAARGRFADASRLVALRPGPLVNGRGLAAADYDNDGRVDLAINTIGGRLVLLHNTSPAAGHWISIRLVGRKSNRDGIGAHVEVTAGGRRQSHERIAGSGYLSQDDPRLHFGLGAASKIERLSVAWPSGARQTLENVAVDRVLTITEP